MKKLLFALFAVSILLVSCSKENKDSDKSVKSDIVGKWIVLSAQTDNGTLDLTSSDILLKYGETSATFNSNGTYEGRGYFGNGSGTYKIEGKTIITIVGGQEYYRYDIVEKTKTTCTLKVYEKGGKDYLIIKCQKS